MFPSYLSIYLSIYIYQLIQRPFIGCSPSVYDCLLYMIATGFQCAFASAFPAVDTDVIEFMCIRFVLVFVLSYFLSLVEVYVCQRDTI